MTKCNTEKEVWKDIDGYDGDYKISNFGNVISFKHNNKGKLLNKNENLKGRHSVLLYKDNKSKTWEVY